MERIINIVNFLRASEDRFEIDLEKPLVEHLKVLQKFDYCATYLLEYDTLVKGNYIDILKNTNADIEIGCWLEIVKQLTDEIGIPYKSKEGWSWDYHTQCSTTAGYTIEEREKLVDAYMTKFKEIFGYFPKSVGAWTIDAFTMNYLKEKYDIKIICICREQCGTDGLSLWGGYYDKIFYPCKNNMLCPAQTEENQIGIPVVRMLGACPVRNYDLRNSTYTMEPYAVEENKDYTFMKNYFKDIIEKPSMNYTQLQLGSENSFGWSIKDCWWEIETPITAQYEELKKVREKVNVRVEKLSETGIWFKNTYKTTPPTTYAYLHEDLERKSIWYSSKYYRANLCILKNTFYLRDMGLFVDSIKERYWTKTINEHGVYYTNMPIIDGYNWSKNIKNDKPPFFFEKKPNSAGIFLCNSKGEEIVFNSFKYYEQDNIAYAEFDTINFGTIIIQFSEECVSIKATKNSENLVLDVRFSMDGCESYNFSQVAFNGEIFSAKINVINDKLVQFEKDTGSYSIKIDNGKIVGNKILFENNLVSLIMKNII